ncbi:hypothetical protein BIW11_13887 [Tropilaelaps mercedesae]|uniref:Uncharacterized protein n=1 Tax=Tropilaelaps mercedesae TaxID=418985 RepID=A0A1V9WZW9_9ACAR|nr:hypothetical protein BIW11_13887 [Tropilaelaps mercedesae]
MTHSGSTLEENIPPGQERSQQKIRSTAALLELVERQKRRKALRAQGTSRPDDQVRLDTYEHSHVVQQDKIAAKTMVSCSSQTCFVQAELRREKSLTEISNLGPSETRVTIESQVSAAQTFVGTPQHFRSNEPRPVSSTSPQQSHTESGTRIRIAASTDIACRPHTSGSSPGARTPPKSPRTPANGNPGTPLSPRTAPNRSPNAKTNPSKSPRISRTPSAGERLGNQTTPPRLCRSKSDPSPKKEVSPRKSPKKTLASSPKSRSSDVLQVKPLVNTYHAITKRPHIQPRRGIPREFQSRNIKEAFTWSNGTADPNVQKKKTTSTAGVGDPLGRNQYATPDAFPVEKIRSEPANSGHPTPRTPSIQSIPPSAVKSGRTEAKPANDVDSVLTGGVTRIEKLYDELTDEYHMPSCHVSSKRQSSKPLVSNAFYPSPPRNLASKCVAMYVPLHGNAKKPTATKPPRVRKYNRSEVLAFMKRKRLERRGLTHSWHAASKETPSGGSDRAIEEPEAVKAKTSKVITENEERFLPIDLTGNVSKLAKDLAVAARQMDADSPELEHFVRLLNKFDSGVTDLLSKCGFDEARLRDAVQKYTITDAPVEERLDKAMKQFEMLLVRLGLRESKLVVEQTSSDGSGRSKLFSQRH